MSSGRCKISRKPHLRGIGVVEHAEDDSGHWVLGVRHVSRRGEGRQVVLQGLAQHAVEGDVRTQDVALLPAVLLQLLDLSPQTVQVLADGGGRERIFECSFNSFIWGILIQHLSCDIFVKLISCSMTYTL